MHTVVLRYQTDRGRQCFDDFPLGSEEFRPVPQGAAYDIPMTIPSLREELLALADEGNAAFLAKLIPGLNPEAIIGARNPALRALAKKLLRERPDEALAFLAELPHGLHEENMLHSFLLGLEKSPDAAFSGVERFLPFVDNWAVCDSLAPAGFARDLERLEGEAEAWVGAGQQAPYTVRFGICMHMGHFLKEHFRPDFLSLIAGIASEEYYVRMAQGWYFAEALAKQPDSALPWFLEDRLPLPVRRKAIQKAVESYRIPSETKDVLRVVRAGLPRA